MSNSLLHFRSLTLYLVICAVAFALLSIRIFAQDKPLRNKRNPFLNPSNEVLPSDAKELTLTGIIIPARHTARIDKKRKEQRQDTRKNRGILPEDETKFVLWTEDGRRMKLPEMIPRFVKNGFYYPYPVVNLAHYMGGKVSMRVLAIETQMGGQTTTEVLHILDINYIPSNTNEIRVLKPAQVEVINDHADDE